jgi:hypothetical protein
MEAEPGVNSGPTIPTMILVNPKMMISKPDVLTGSGVTSKLIYSVLLLVRKIADGTETDHHTIFMEFVDNHFGSTLVTNRCRLRKWDSTIRNHFL